MLTGFMTQSIAQPPTEIVRVSSSQDLTNQTACIYAKQFNLGEQVYLTVCYLGGDTLIDLRRFFNHSPPYKPVAVG